MAEYKIVIDVNGSGSGEKKSPIAKSSAASSSGATAGATDGISGKKAAVKAIAVMDIAKRLYLTARNFQVNTVELKTGSQALQDRLRFRLDVGVAISNALESLAVGALVGNLPGAVIGLTSSVTTSLISYSQKQQQIRLQQAVESVGLQLNNIRAGAGMARDGRQI